jgi:hypothetical protein
MAEQGRRIATRCQSAMGSLQRRTHDRPAVFAVDDEDRDLVVLLLRRFGEQRSVCEGTFQGQGARRTAGTRWRRPRLDGHLFRAGDISREELDHGLTDAVEVGAELLQHLGGDTFAFTDEAEQDVLGADVVVAELEGLAERELEDVLGTRRERDLTGRLRLTFPDDLLDLLTDRFERDIQGIERSRTGPFSHVDQGQEDVLCPDVVVVEHPRFFMSEGDDPPCSVGESLEQRTPFDRMLVLERSIELGPGRPNLPLRRPSYGLPLSELSARRYSEWEATSPSGESGAGSDSGPPSGLSGRRSFRSGSTPGGSGSTVFRSSFAGGGSLGSMSPPTVAHPIPALGGVKTSESVEQGAHDHEDQNNPDSRETCYPRSRSLFPQAGAGELSARAARKTRTEGAGSAKR